MNDSIFNHDYGRRKNDPHKSKDIKIIKLRISSNLVD